MSAQAAPRENNDAGTSKDSMPVATRGQKLRDAELFSPNDVALRWSRVYKAVRIFRMLEAPPPPRGALSRWQRRSTPRA